MNVSPSDEFWMRHAVAEAHKAAALGEIPVGAVVVQGDRIVGRGHNVREHTHDPTAHAEMIAIRDASRCLHTWRLTDCDLYVTLEPCAMCAGAIVHARMRRLVFGASDPKTGYVGSLYNTLTDTRLNHQPHIIPHVLQEECSALLRSFFRDLRSRKRSLSLPMEPGQTDPV